MWPKIKDKDGARKVAKWGFHASWIISAITTFQILFDYSSPSLVSYPMTYWGFVDVALFGLAAFMIRRMSRGWAVFALVLYFAEIEWAVRFGRIEASIIATLIIIYAFVNGVRGTFAYHRFLKTEQSSLPSS